jgi:predicted nuclease with TOPRIM domain
MKRAEKILNKIKEEKVNENQKLYKGALNAYNKAEELYKQLEKLSKIDSNYSKSFKVILDAMEKVNDELSDIAMENDPDMI